MFGLRIGFIWCCCCMLTMDLSVPEVPPPAEVVSQGEGEQGGLRIRASARKKHVNLAVFRVVLVCQLAPLLA
jgi:hypothetical protein